MWSGRPTDWWADGFILGTTMPTPSNTGVPAGTALRAVTGDVQVTQSGVLLEGLDISGFLRIRANNVWVRNCRIRGGVGTAGTFRAFVDVNSTAYSGTVLERCSIGTAIADGGTPTVDSYGPTGSGFSLIRCCVRGVVDGLNTQGHDIAVWGNYLETVTLPNDPRQGGGASHSDGIQAAFGTRWDIRGNYLTVEPTGTANAASAMLFSPYAGDIRDVVVDSNWIVGDSTGAAGYKDAIVTWRPTGNGDAGTGDRYTVTNNRIGACRDETNFKLGQTVVSSGNVLYPAGTPIVDQWNA